MSLHRITIDLETQWRRCVRREHPAARWATTDRAIPANEAGLRRMLRDVFSPAGRDLFAKLVSRAITGDTDAALIATLTVLERMLRWEGDPGRVQVSTTRVEYDALAAAVWEAVVTETRPQRPFLRERIEQRAWHIVKKPVLQSQREPATGAPGHTDHYVDVDTVDTVRIDLVGLEQRGRPRATVAPRHGETRADAAYRTVDSHVTIDALLDRLAAERRLPAATRMILERVAAGGHWAAADDRRSLKAQQMQRWRLMRALRDDPRLRSALAS